MLINRHIGWPGAVVLGVSSGAGFATLETMGYGFAALLNGGGLVALDGTLLLRALLAPAGHIAWTGLSMGASGGFGARPTAPVPSLRRRCLLGVVILDGLWDASASSIIRIVVALLSFGALMLTLSAARCAENRRYAAQA